jgi:xylulokinase
MFIGLDLGTSGLKAILLDDRQQLIAEAHCALALSRPHDGWSEQDPEDWTNALRKVLTDLHLKHALSSVQAIGLSGHMHGATFLDASGQVIRPCILWNDTRAAQDAAKLDAIPEFRQITGNIVFAGFTAPKALWLTKHEPENFNRIDKVLLPKDYLRFWLTGDFVSDLSDASGTGWLDVGKRDWSQALLDHCGLSTDQMPSLCEGSDATGTLRKELAAEFGMSDRVVIAGGAGDNASAAIGLGVIRAGDAFVSLGTSGVLFAATDSFQPDAGSAVHSFCHALPNQWHQMGVILSAADALNWFAKLVSQSAQQLTANLGELQAPSRTVFLPYLSGERTPINNPNIRGAFIGLEHATDTKAATRAVLEGISYALLDCQNALIGTGTEINSLLATGGGAKSHYWLSLLATVLDRPILLPKHGDYGAAFGAARLGMLAMGATLGDVASKPEIEREFTPQRALRDEFTAGYDHYRSAARGMIGLQSPT